MNTETRECIEMLIKVLDDLKHDPDTTIGFGMRAIVNISIINAKTLLAGDADASNNPA